MKGVYTANCPGCAKATVLHVDGSKLDPAQCRECSTKFIGIEQGETRRTYVLTTDKVRDEKPLLDEEGAIVEKPKKKWGKKKS